ncbi:TRAP-T type transporter subunit DctP [Planococcus antarcticus DSM 14505]|uniref:C4-dicarboxylate ABC transporter substrate-binding protein n=1 Tax=Planococcus antarcticus DSM 14505 TaxID=1185653 RepID=A0A1C7DG77_9BACL|nr:DctP family TRAP transporter solute-binding subunit [Planococcus antarcticus]ANU10271.1 C4-dicarboxylate ABC transporter substrate-binding protein [Planococcus antarcticus DSM 14505]EIM07181.1 TRAP-T type transporter subunit DctP [Planococcus antarcticus DSM 14505]
MKKLLGLFLIGLFILSACGRPDSGTTTEDGENSDETFTIRLAHLVPEEQSSHIAAVAFKEKLESESDGQLKVELYPNGQLYGSDREAIEAVQLGNVEMTIPAVAAMASFNEKFQVFDLPFLFNNNEAAYRALDGELGQELLADLENNGMKGLVFGENGFRHVSNNEGPIESPEDMQGLKMRTLESPLHTDTFNAFGANASPFAFGELYTALQQGTYDAMDCPISLYYTNKFYEVQDYLTLTGHVYAATALLVNDDFYNSLPDDLQDIITEAAEDFRTEQRELAQQQDGEFLDQLESEGMQVNDLTDEQRNEFREAAESVYTKYEDQIGRDVIDQALAANEE